MRAGLKIGILQTDSVLDQFVAEHGDYSDMFIRLLGESAPQEVSFRTFNVLVGELPEPGDCDGYVITGSRQSVYDPDPWIKELAAFVDSARAVGRKMVGICFGHQLIAHFGGGRTAAAEAGWVVGVNKTEIVEHYQWMSPRTNEIALLSSHKDQVAELPEGATLIATTARCPIAGYVIGDQVLCLQGHPEFAAAYSAALMTMRREVLGEIVYKEGMGSLQIPTTERLVATWIMQFLHGRTQ